MKYPILLLLLLSLVSCSFGPVYVYNYQPVIKILADSTEAKFFVKDLSPDGWWSGDGVDSLYFKIQLSETKKVKSYVTDIKFNLVTEDFGSVFEDRVSFITPLELSGTKSDTLTLPLSIDERSAYYVDLSDGINDNVGTAVFIIKAIYYDEFGKSYESLPFYLPVKVIKP
ncbi:MAG: hypothetical protein QME48_05190 [bacterium]|uniref:Lipoprotein n=2 Tax=Bacteria candidate phyla TaxID=1783234 RepID=A0A124G0L8_UNCT6|nr:MAG: hypothetical protein XD76_0676 [candidate division TA06 bacterium 32_111]KUK87862.1 MAG: hypothetical protein XE03_0381 [candidate division TA06 bacterium 34_109]MDI6700609.1 hypothetical protein [bacterium]HAF08014.1 hypothetical protein [candidate division WOR-3 bacterium]HCP16284.1 hypothetical protein [candidate division WOR-3 bacterium]